MIEFDNDITIESTIYWCNERNKRSLLLISKNAIVTGLVRGKKLQQFNGKRFGTNIVKNSLLRTLVI